MDLLVGDEATKTIKMRCWDAKGNPETHLSVG